MSTNDQPSNVGNNGTMMRGTGWMYEGANNSINKEEYLLGKQIGNNFEAEGTAGQINAVEYDVAPPSIFASRATHQVDLARKLMEDPLVAIKKREVEDRKRLMDNPVKMKQLQEHLQSLEKKSKKSKKHKKEKKSKHKKRERNRSRSRSIKRERSRSRSRSRPRKIQKQQKRRERSRSGSSDSDDADLDLKLLKKIQAMERGGGGDDDDESDEYESDDEAEERKKQAILAAGIDPDNVDAPLFSNTARKKGRENSPEKGKGDWDCLKCGNWNFVRRTECFKCNTKKGEGKAREHAPLFVPIPIAKIKKPAATPVLKKKPGQAPKPGETPGEASPPSGGRGGGDRPGDWKCLKQGCGYSNFASRSSCNKCSTAKGEKGEDKPVRAAYQRKEGRASTPGGTLLGSPSPPRRRNRSGTSPREGVRGSQGQGRAGRRRSPSRDRRRSPSRDRRRDRSRSPRAGYRGRRSPSTPPRYRRNRSPTSPPRRQEGAPGGKREGAQNSAPTAGKAGAKGLSDAEKQAKLAEMMANADWRDGQRTARVGKYREEQAKEDEEAKREHDPGFLNRELKRAHENLTIEGRITSNKHNIQRGVGVMDKNFAKR